MLTGGHGEVICFQFRYDVIKGGYSHKIVSGFLLVQMGAVSTG